MSVWGQDRKGTYRYLTFVLLTLLFSTSLAVSAYSGQYEDADAAYERGDYATAYRLIKPMAEQGKAAAQFNLALMYDNGQGVTKNYAEAVKWFRRAAEQGDADAQFNLALKYAKGQGVPQDYTEAMKWYRKAAEQGYAQAQNNLALMYGDGKGVTKNYAEAVKWFRRAAEQGDAKAQNNLGIMYEEGQGVPQDYILAHMWFNLAASRLPALEGENREQAVKSRDITASKMTPAQIAEAQRLAREWKPKKEGK